MRAPKLLKAWRTAHGLSQLAAAMRIGVTQGTWALWEREVGGKSPRIDRALAIERLTKGAVPVGAWAKRAA